MRGSPGRTPRGSTPRTSSAGATSPRTARSAPSRSATATAAPAAAPALEIARGIELGHVFALGRKYADTFGLTALDQNGKPVTVTMGSYGVGVTRAVAAVAEQTYDDKGLCWPRSIAPADVHLVATGKDDAVFDAAARLADELEAAGIEVLYDDRRQVSPGVKFKDAELLGVPTVVVVGRGLADGVVEVRDRRSDQRQEVPVAEAAGRITDRGPGLMPHDGTLRRVGLARSGHASSSAGRTRSVGPATSATRSGGSRPAPTRAAATPCAATAPTARSRTCCRAPWNARTRVHEYGGGAWAVSPSGALVFAEFTDQRLYLLDVPGGAPVALTPLPPKVAAWRYGEVQIVGDEVWCVRERHDDDGAVHRDLAAVPLDGRAADDQAAIRTVLSGSHFLAGARVSPDGRQVAWIAWEHPQMPWDGTELRVAELVAGVATDARTVLGSTTESVLQPEWADEATAVRAQRPQRVLEPLPPAGRRR